MELSLDATNNDIEPGFTHKAAYKPATSKFWTDELACELDDSRPAQTFLSFDQVEKIEGYGIWS